MDGGRNHAATGSKSENTRVSLRRVRAGGVEAIDGDVRDAGRRNRPDAASGGAGGFASGVQARSAGERGRVFAEKSGSVLWIREKDAVGGFACGDALCRAPAGVGPDGRRAAG